jgi:hypothetical protein
MAIRSRLCSDHAKAVRCDKASALVEGSQEKVDFGMTDSKGRALGFSFTIFRIEMTAQVGDFRAAYVCDAPGVYFEVRTSVTRNGKNYGPAFNGFYADSFEEAVAGGRAKAAAAAKRYAKNPPR